MRLFLLRIVANVVVVVVLLFLSLRIVVNVFVSVVIIVLVICKFVMIIVRGVIWYGADWCDNVRYGMVWYGMVSDCTSVEGRRVSTLKPIIVLVAMLVTVLEVLL